MSCRSMDLTTTPGAMVVYCYPENGYEFDQLLAKKHLYLGYAYTVSEMDVGDSSSRVRLMEKPGMWFNTVLFDNVDERDTETVVEATLS